MKLSNFEFHKKNLKIITEMGRAIKRILKFSKKEPFYQRDPGRGWWMVIKEITVQTKYQTKSDQCYINDCYRQKKRILVFNNLRVHRSIMFSNIKGFKRN